MIKAFKIGCYQYPVRHCTSGARVSGLSGWVGSLPAFLTGMRASEGGSLILRDNTTIPLWDGSKWNRDAARAIWKALHSRQVDEGRAVARIDEACRWGDPDSEPASPPTWTEEDDARR